MDDIELNSLLGNGRKKYSFNNQCCTMTIQRTILLLVMTILIIQIAEIIIAVYTFNHTRNYTI